MSRLGKTLSFWYKSPRICLAIVGIEVDVPFAHYMYLWFSLGRPELRSPPLSLRIVLNYDRRFEFNNINVCGRVA